MNNFLPSPFEWCAVSPGDVVLTNIEDPFNVAAFDMAKYPITNAQFQVFVDAEDGYSNADWWNFSPAAARWHIGKEPTPIPFPGDDLPRSSVSWYEAVAFCHWLMAKTGEKIGLPTEQEWQRAAQGNDSRLYPWGTAFDRLLGNTGEAGIKVSTPVTQYPGGASPYGVMDLCGNTSDWCLNEFNMPDSISFSGSEIRAIRGGSWALSQYSALTNFRGYNYAGDRVNYQGFRLVRRV